MIGNYANIPSQLQQLLHTLPSFHLDSKVEEKDLARFSKVARKELFGSILVTDIGWYDESSIAQMKIIMDQAVLLKIEIVIVLSSLKGHKFIRQQVQSVRSKTIIFVGNVYHN